MSENQKLSSIFHQLLPIVIIIIIHIIYNSKDGSVGGVGVNGAIIKWNNNTLDMDFLNPFGWENNIVPSDEDDAIIDINDMIIVGTLKEIHVNSLLLESNTRMSIIQPFTTSDNCTIGINSFLESRYTRARTLYNRGIFKGNTPHSILEDTILHNYGSAMVSFINHTELASLIQSPSNFYQNSQLYVENSKTCFYNYSEIKLFDNSTTTYVYSTVQHLASTLLFNNSIFKLGVSTVLFSPDKQLLLNDTSKFYSKGSHLYIKGKFKGHELSTAEFILSDLVAYEGGEIDLNNAVFVNSNIVVMNGSQFTNRGNSVQTGNNTILYSTLNGTANLKGSSSNLINFSIIAQQGGIINIDGGMVGNNISIIIGGGDVDFPTNTSIQSSSSSSNSSSSNSSSSSSSRSSSSSSSSGHSQFSNTSILTLHKNSNLNYKNSNINIVENGEFHLLETSTLILSTNTKFLNNIGGYFNQQGVVYVNSVSCKFENKNIFDLSSNILTSLNDVNVLPILLNSAGGLISIINTNDELIKINIPILNSGGKIKTNKNSNLYIQKFTQENKNSILELEENSQIISNNILELNGGKVIGSGRIDVPLFNHTSGEIGSRNVTGVINISGDYTLSNNGVVVILINSLDDFSQIHIEESAILRGDIEIKISNKISSKNLKQLEVVNFHDLNKYSITFRNVKYSTFDPDTGYEYLGHECAQSIATDDSFSILIRDCQSPISTGVVIGIVAGCVFLVILIGTFYHFKKPLSKKWKYFKNRNNPNFNNSEDQSGEIQIYEINVNTNNDTINSNNTENSNNNEIIENIGGIDFNNNTANISNNISINVA